ncbi:MAG: ABC transporter substrate-binding protein [Rhodospirillales bacterium]|nr:ABC transporter substrate-binding protein [Rhodospirillales bacterium]MCB9996395.1 ABC transporter substrate-binding protein [Rhodospirillales bacterium]
MMKLILTLLLLPLFSVSASAEEAAEAADAMMPPPSITHGIAMHGDPKYGPDFTHFDYANPDAPKGGTLRMWGNETFDTLNGFSTKGVAADGLGLLYDSLMEKSQDEPFSMYGALAESVETPPDRSWVTFRLRPQAKWNDGKPVTAQDVVWTFETLTTKARPFYKAYYANVQNVEALDEHTVKFTFDMANNRELPLIIGEMPILPQHYWQDKDFEATTLEPPVGSGPYQVGKIVPGRSIEFIRNKDWWGKDLPVFKGRYNFDRITYDYYRDQNISLEALFADEYDFRQEYTAKLWATAYDAPPVKDGRIAKKIIHNGLPQGMQAFAFNMRRDTFKDLNVRKAINYAFDFEWANKQFAYGAYERTGSYFENSEMAATGLPEGRELEILEQFRGQVPDSVFTEEFKLPSTDGSGKNRDNLRTAMKLLDKAGYVMKDGVRTHKDSGEKIEFEVLVANTNAAFERWFQPWKQNLERLGIKANIRIVDASQYINLIMGFDYDVIVASWGQSTSPGNEQREFWGSDRADAPGSRNFIGIKDPVVDALIDMIVSAPTREELVLRCRALDRVLLDKWVVVPNWHLAAWRIAYWDKFGQPETQAPYSLGVMDTWWAK